MGLVSFHGDENLKRLAIGSKDSIFDPKTLEESFGIPGWVCQIKSLFFKYVEKDESDKFDLDLLNSIPIGVNLDPVKWKFLSYILTQCINMLMNQSGTEKFIKEKNVIIPYLEKTKSYYESFFEHRCEDEASHDFDLVSRTLLASIPRGLDDIEYDKIYEEHSKKLIELFKKENNILFFKFKGVDKQKDSDVSISCNEKTKLIPTNKSISIKYLKSIIKRITT